VVVPTGFQEIVALLGKVTGQITDDNPFTMVHQRTHFFLGTSRSSGTKCTLNLQELQEKEYLSGDHYNFKRFL
jgi:hypothetical protein